MPDTGIAGFDKVFVRTLFGQSTACSAVCLSLTDRYRILRGCRTLPCEIFAGDAAEAIRSGNTIGEKSRSFRFAECVRGGHACRHCGTAQVKIQPKNRSCLCRFSIKAVPDKSLNVTAFSSPCLYILPGGGLYCLLLMITLVHLKVSSMQRVLVNRTEKPDRLSGKW